MDASMFAADGSLTESGMAYLEPLVFAGRDAADVITSEDVTDPVQQKAVTEFWDSAQAGIVDQPNPA